MSTINEGKHEGEFIGELSMGVGYHVEEIVLQTPEDLEGGALLSKTETGTPTATAAAAYSGTGGTVGNGAVSAVSADPGAAEGKWLVQFTTTGATAAFKVTKPDGTPATPPTGAVGTAYNGTGGINFSVADGANDYTAGDVLPINVSYDGDDHVAEYVEYDGTNSLDAVLMKNTDASAGDVKTTALVRGPAVINKNDLTWFSGATATQKAKGIQLLLDLGIKAA